MFDRPGIDASEVIDQFKLARRLALPRGVQAGAIHMDGPQVVRLMRVNGVTIREFKRRSGITLKTIRMYRTDGVTGADVLAVFEYVAGSIPPRVKAAWMQTRRQQFEIV